MPYSYGMEYFTGNVHTTRAERRLNAKYAYYFLQRFVGGWTLESIAAMCGNWESESGINPGIWENLTIDPARGYGLVQWTPSTKLTAWAAQEHLDPADMATNLLRIEYELQNGLQWQSSYLFPMTFTQFKYSRERPFRLAQAFCINYENATSPDLHERGTQANNWYRYLNSLPKPILTSGNFWMFYMGKYLDAQRRV